MKTLARYVTRLRKQAVPDTQSQRWVSVEVVDRSAEAGSELTVVLGCGRKVEVRRGFGAETLRDIVTVLEGIG
jgi:hypothetical protein